MDAQQLRNILESCLLVAGKAMSIAQMEVLFEEDIDRPERGEIKQALLALQQDYEGRGIELVEVASGWRLQSCASMEHWVARLLEERAPRYSRALLETLVLIAYRQPITRGEIEEVRGVAVSSNIIRTLQERDWIKEMGFKDVPGKPALWGTTKEFLDYFNLKRLDELPTLAEARDLAEIDAALAAEVGLVDGVADSVAANDAQGEDGQGGDPVDGNDDSDPITDPDETHDNMDEISASADAEGDDTQQDSDLVSLAANLNTGSREQPDLGAMVDGFGQHPDAENPVDAIEGDVTGEEGSQVPVETESDAEALTLYGDSASEPAVSEDSESGDNDGNSPALEAMEISAHDIDIDEWKEPVSQVPRAADSPEPGGDSPDHSSGDKAMDLQRHQAESDLRRVIDDFAEEHQQQLDADSELRSRHVNGLHTGAQKASESVVNESWCEPVSTEGDDHVSQSSQTSAAENLPESELAPKPESDDDSVDNEQGPNSANSGEP